MTSGESTDAEVTEALEALKAYPWPVRLDGHSHPGTWLLRWAGVSPETRDNADSVTIIRTHSWERYCRVVRMALNCRKPVVLPVYSARGQQAIRHDRESCPGTTPVRRYQDGGPRREVQTVKERPEKRQHKLSALYSKRKA